MIPQTPLLDGLLDLLVRDARRAGRDVRCGERAGPRRREKAQGNGKARSRRCEQKLP